MRYVSFRNRFLFPALTLLLGLCLGGIFPHTPIHAVATDRTESFLAATGMVDSDVEAIYLLDCLTGDLRAAVLGKARGGFTAIFVYPGVKLMQDFGLDPSKNPKFLMVTGLADLRSGSQNAFGAAVVYVVELSSGKIAAYAIPWNRTRLEHPKFRQRRPHARGHVAVPQSAPAGAGAENRRHQGRQGKGERIGSGNSRTMTKN